MLSMFALYLNVLNRYTDRLNKFRPVTSWRIHSSIIAKIMHVERARDDRVTAGESTSPNFLTRVTLRKKRIDRQVLKFFSRQLHNRYWQSWSKSDTKKRRNSWPRELTGHFTASWCWILDKLQQTTSRLKYVNLLPKLTLYFAYLLPK